MLYNYTLNNNDEVHRCKNRKHKKSNITDVLPAGMENGWTFTEYGFVRNG